MRPVTTMQWPAGLRSTVLVATLLLVVDASIMSYGSAQTPFAVEKKQNTREQVKTFGATLHSKRPIATDIVAAKRRAERKKLEQQTNRVQQVRAEREELKRQIKALQAEIESVQAECDDAKDRAESAAREAALQVAAGAGIGAALGGPLGAAVGAAIGGANAADNAAAAAAAIRECQQRLAELSQQLEALQQQIAKIQEETEALLRELQKAQADLQNKRERGEWQAKREEWQVKRPSIPAVDKSKLGAIPRSGDADKLIRPATGAAAKSGPASRSTKNTSSDTSLVKPCQPGQVNDPCKSKSRVLSPGLLEGSGGVARQGGPAAVGTAAGGGGGGAPIGLGDSFRVR